ncbi:MAG: LysR family transcriptional regulator [Gammaproteobacteria bacterium]|nr:LysR family transcriptional regulator [Gammaproteobacteria bacterium]
MELKWLEDFLALANNKNFSKAAKTRFVTQPAFSRRIRSLENWLGVSLVDRTRVPTSLTEAGMEFIDQAENIKAQIYAARDKLNSLANEHSAMIVMSQHSLAVSFFPTWLHNIESFVGDALIKVNAGNLHDSLESFLAGTGDFLLCFSTPDVLKQLERNDIESVQVGVDRLIPVSAVNAEGKSVFSTTQSNSLRLLSYPQDSFFGKLITNKCMPLSGSDLKLHKVCENALAEGLKALVDKEYGVAWLPECLVAKELSEGSMVMLGAPLRSIDLAINLYRFKKERSNVASVFWKYVAELYDNGDTYPD